MWIIPSNLPLSSRSALEYLGSSEDLKELASIPVSWPTWKSKPTSLQTWLRAWKRVYWIQHLFGRTLKPSMHDRFVEEYTASLAVIHVPENPLPGYGKATSIKDSFGQLYGELSRQPDLFSASSKTWMTTLLERIRLYKEAYTIWVTGLRAEYTQRKKWVHHKNVNGSLSSHWPTPTTPNGGRGLPKSFQMRGNQLYSGERKVQIHLHHAVKMWPTASARDWKSGESNQHGKNSRPLNEMVKLWATPSANLTGETVKNLIKRMSLYNNSKKKGEASFRGMGLDIQVSQWARVMNSTNGNTQEKLNPAWVAQLMGTTLEKIFFVPLATQWSNKQQN